MSRPDPPSTGSPAPSRAGTAARRVPAFAAKLACFALAATVWGAGIAHASMLFARGGGWGLLFFLLWFFGGQFSLVRLARRCFGRLCARLLAWAFLTLDAALFLFFLGLLLTAIP